ncbi:MAG: transglycosylase SLT domain-containing protein [Alphaproteobacteria bacterium]
MTLNDAPRSKRRLRAVAVAAALLAAPPAGALAQPLGELAMRAWIDAGAAALAGDWTNARLLAEGAGSPAAVKLIRWIDWTRGDGPADPVEIAAFVTANPDWPGFPRLRRRIEDQVGPQTPDPFLIDWFTRHPPETGRGAIAYGEALQRAGRADDARAALREAWRIGNFLPAEEADFLARHGAALRPQDDIDRLDRLIWDNELVSAKRMLARAGAARRVAELRIRLRSSQGAAGLEALSPAERADAGLAFDLLRHYRRVEDDAAAERMLLSDQRDAVRPDSWWVERNLVARRALRNGARENAYRIAAGHRLGGGNALAEAEFLAGWIALRFLGDPVRAEAHFARLEASVGRPISLARAAYWLGRTSEAAGDKAAAAERYQRAADHLGTFYGQLAAERIGGATAPRWIVEAPPPPTAAETAAFDRTELVQAARLLAAIGEGRRARPFVLQLSEQAEGPGQHQLLAGLAAEIAQPGAAVQVAKRASYDGVHLPGHNFPVRSVPDAGAAEPALVHAVIRQESEFDPTAISRAGARGLMQLMPATARQVAAQIAERHDNGRLITDPAYNVRLGSQYLGAQIEAFSGSYIMAVAAYNAGPNRVRRWVEDYGDPRAGVDPVDWIELIPFSETRNYVQRVMENLQVYRWRIAGPNRPLRLTADLRR